MLVFYVLLLGACVLQQSFERAPRASASLLELPVFLGVPQLLLLLKQGKKILLEAQVLRSIALKKMHG